MQKLMLKVKGLEEKMELKSTSNSVRDELMYEIYDLKL